MLSLVQNHWLQSSQQAVTTVESRIQTMHPFSVTGKNIQIVFRVLFVSGVAPFEPFFLEKRTHPDSVLL